MHTTLPNLANDITKHVGIWIRVSTEDQARGESPEHHEKRARAYAEAKGWTVCELYNLAGVSGKAVMHHPEAQRMLKDIRSGHIKGLIFSKLARLARNTRELLDFADIFRDQGADLVSLQESIDTSTPAGRLFYTMIAAMSQWEREEIAERVAVSVPIRAKLGKRLGGDPPFGYKWHEKKLILNEVEAPIRRQVYELFAQHRRKRVVARILNEAGHRTRDKVPFTHLYIKRIISDPISKGLRRANYTRFNGRQVVFKPENEWVMQPAPAVVSEELWDQCNAILADQRSSRRPVAKRAVHLFAGVTFCRCGTKMYVRSNTPKYVCEKCRMKIPIVDLEAIFREQLHQISFPSEELKAYLVLAKDGLKQKEDALKSLQVEQDRVTKAMDRVYDLYVEGQITPEGFGSRYRPLEVQHKQLNDELPRLQAEVDFMKISTLSSDEIVSNAQNLYDRWPSLTREEKRQITEAITKKIVIDKGEIDIELCYLPSLPSPSPKDDKKGANPFNFAPAKIAFLASSTAM